jgi:hypothetical protein
MTSRADRTDLLTTLEAEADQQLVTLIAETKEDLRVQEEIKFIRKGVASQLQSLKASVEAAHDGGLQLNASQRKSRDPEAVQLRRMLVRHEEGIEKQGRLIKRLEKLLFRRFDQMQSEVAALTKRRDEIDRLRRSRVDMDVAYDKLSKDALDAVRSCAATRARMLRAQDRVRALKHESGALREHLSSLHSQVHKIEMEPPRNPVIDSLSRGGGAHRSAAGETAILQATIGGTAGKANLSSVELLALHARASLAAERGSPAHSEGNWNPDDHYYLMQVTDEWVKTSGSRKRPGSGSHATTPVFSVPVPTTGSSPVRLSRAIPQVQHPIVEVDQQGTLSDIDRWKLLKAKKEAEDAMREADFQLTLKAADLGRRVQGKGSDRRAAQRISMRAAEAAEVKQALGLGTISPELVRLYLHPSRKPTSTGGGIVLAGADARSEEAQGRMLAAQGGQLAHRLREALAEEEAAAAVREGVISGEVSASSAGTQGTVARVDFQQLQHIIDHEDEEDEEAVDDARQIAAERALWEGIRTRLHVKKDLKPASAMVMFRSKLAEAEKRRKQENAGLERSTSRGSHRMQRRRSSTARAGGWTEIKTALGTQTGMQELLKGRQVLAGARKERVQQDLSTRKEAAKYALEEVEREMEEVESRARAIYELCVLTENAPDELVEGEEKRERELAGLASQTAEAGVRVATTETRLRRTLEALQEVRDERARAVRVGGVERKRRELEAKVGALQTTRLAVDEDLARTRKIITRSVRLLAEGAEEVEPEAYARAISVAVATADRQALMSSLAAIQGEAAAMLHERPDATDHADFPPVPEPAADEIDPAIAVAGALSRSSPRSSGHSSEPAVSSPPAVRRSRSYSLLRIAKASSVASPTGEDLAAMTPIGADAAQERLAGRQDARSKLSPLRDPMPDLPEEEGAIHIPSAFRLDSPTDPDEEHRPVKLMPIDEGKRTEDEEHEKPASGPKKLSVNTGGSSVGSGIVPFSTTSHGSGPYTDSPSVPDNMPKTTAGRVRGRRRSLVEGIAMSALAVHSQSKLTEPAASPESSHRPSTAGSGEAIVELRNQLEDALNVRVRSSSRRVNPAAAAAIAEQLAPDAPVNQSVGIEVSDPSLSASPTRSFGGVTKLAGVFEPSLPELETDPTAWGEMDGTSEDDQLALDAAGALRWVQQLESFVTEVRAFEKLLAARNVKDPSPSQVVEEARVSRAKPVDAEKDVFDESGRAKTPRMR